MQKEENHMKTNLFTKFRTTAIIILLSFLSIGCGKNYSGKFLYVDQQLERFLTDGSGRLYDPNGMAALGLMFRSDVRETHKFSTVKHLLTLEQKGKDVTGKLSVTAGNQVIDFVVRTGYKADKTGLLHLDLTLDPQSSGEAGAVMALMGTGKNLLIKMDEVKSKSAKDLNFSIEDPYGVFKGVSRAFPKEESYRFQKIELSEMDAIIEDRLNQTRSHAVEILKMTLKDKDISSAKSLYSALEDCKFPIPDEVKSKFLELSKNSSKSRRK
jgi:hypothetical protein